MIETIAALENPAGNHPIPIRIVIAIPIANACGFPVTHFWVKDLSIVPINAPAK